MARRLLSLGLGPGGGHVQSAAAAVSPDSEARKLEVSPSRAQQAGMGMTCTGHLHCVALQASVELLE
jgi:hypothetical protein